MKNRRQRLQLTAAGIALAVALSGFFLYRSISAPRAHVAHVAKTWLDNTSGKKHHASVHHAHKSSSHRLAHHHKKHHGKALAHHKKHKKHRSALAQQQRKAPIQDASYKSE